jgi:hypothetical protein
MARTTNVGRLGTLLLGACMSFVTFVSACGGDEDGECMPDEKTCTVDGQATCVERNDPFFGCTANSCTPCDIPNAAASCSSAGQCVIAICEPGFFDCEPNVPGCETDVSVTASCDSTGTGGTVGSGGTGGGGTGGTAGTGGSGASGGTGGGGVGGGGAGGGAGEAGAGGQGGAAGAAGTSG